MLSRQIRFYIFAFSIALGSVISVANQTAVAQDNCVTYGLVPMTVYEKQPVKVTRWVDETVTEKKQVTSYKPAWRTEKRTRTHVTFKRESLFAKASRRDFVSR